MRKSGLPPVVDENTEILILGTLPSDTSLAAGQYYANPGNDFWKLVGAALDKSIAGLSYDDKLELLKANRIGLWDAFQTCFRPGSMDSDITERKLNDFKLLKDIAPSIRLICINGKGAAEAEESLHGLGLKTLLLPSSSAANRKDHLERSRRWKAMVAPQTVNRNSQKNPMDICVLIFGSTIRWLLSPSDPKLYEIPSMPGVRFVSPLLFGEIEKRLDAKRVDNRQFDGSGYVGKLYFLETQGIAFAIEADFVEQYKPKDVTRFASYRATERPPFIDLATSLLEAMRFLSKQHDMSPGGDDLNFWEWLAVDEFPSFSPSTVTSPDSIRHVLKSTVATAIAKKNVEVACSQMGRTPIHDTLFLDAISAHWNHDYRKSILYSAMALEAATATVMDEFYESRIKPRDAKMWRVVEFRTGGGATARKDPIWDLLKQREDANSLLHEGALYVLGKSLRIENETLFQFMQRLRSTRNKIVHRGEPPDAADNTYLSIDMLGSSDALNCTNEVLKWLGVGRDYKLHEKGFVRIWQTPQKKSR